MLRQGEGSLLPAHVRKMRRYFALIFFVIVASWTYLDYWAYSVLYHAHLGQLLALVGGHGLAPAQYRVEVLMFAHLFVEHTRLGYRHVFALFDFVCTLSAGWLLLEVLLRTRSFAEASRLSQWLRLFTVLGLAVFYLSWADWYQRPETMECTLYVAASVYLISVAGAEWAVFAGLIVLSVLQGFDRADEAMIFNFALFVYVLFRGTRGMAARRGLLLGASAIGGAAATLTLWLLKYKFYPHATYGKTAVIQLFGNVAPMTLIAFLPFIVPVAYTFWRSRSVDGASEGQAHVLLLACALYLCSWAAVGRLREVRIFLPFAFALMPQTANAIVNRLGDASEQRSTAPGEML